MASFETHDQTIPEKSADTEKLEQIHRRLIQDQRWIAMGRVVAAISHEITNRMQAVQGALSLAAEEHSLSEDLKAYLDLSMQETRRIIGYLQRLRRVYHPETDSFEAINVQGLLTEVRDLTSDTAAGGTVKVEFSVAPNLPPLQCKGGQLEFILLGVVLHLADLTSSDESARIYMEAKPSGSGIRFEISTNSPLADWMEEQKDESVLERALGISSFREAAAAQNGTLGLSSSDSGPMIWISLPLIP